MLHLRPRFPEKNDPRYGLHTIVTLKEDASPLLFGRLELERHAKFDPYSEVDPALFITGNGFVDLPDPNLLMKFYEPIAQHYFETNDIPKLPSLVTRLINTMRYDRISRKHFEVSWSDDGFYISDVGSSLGTLLDTTRLGEGELHKLKDGSVITVGPKEGFQPVMYFDVSISNRRTTTRLKKFDA